MHFFSGFRIFKSIHLADGGSQIRRSGPKLLVIFIERGEIARNNKTDSIEKGWKYVSYQPKRLCLLESWGG